MNFTRWLFSSLLLSISIVCGSSVHAATQMTLYINDAQSSPVAALDKFGNVLWTERYQSYGQPQDQPTAAKAHPISYTTHEFDRDSQLIYMGGRYYDAKLGRFLSVDPVEFAEANVFSFNRYAYANNNPYAFHDPDGQFPLDYLVDGISIGISAGLFANDPSVGNALGLAGDVLLGVIPYVPSGIGILRAADKAGDASKVVKSGEHIKDFFEGTKYTEKVKVQMKNDDFHSFPKSVKAFQGDGSVKKITGGDGVVREELKIPGEYRGREGNFEFIKEPDGKINHRLFRQNSGGN